jgi:hydrogenase maturation factor
MSCDEAHCITCSDEGVPMRVRDVRADGIAVCDDGRGPDGAPAEPVEVMVDLVAPVEPGDELLVHAGVALTRLT